jgi:oxygen-dependent protoporphyrinogen oxidase
MERIEARLATLPSLALAGSAYRGVGIPQVILSGSQAAERIVRAASGTAIRAE